MKTLKTFIGAMMILMGFIMLPGQEGATLAQTVVWILVGFAVAAVGYRILCSAHPEFNDSPETV